MNEGRKEERKKGKRNKGRNIETTAAKHNGLPITMGGHKK